jgi:hypothetical protein
MQLIQFFTQDYYFLPNDEVQLPSTSVMARLQVYSVLWNKSEKLFSYRNLGDIAVIPPAKISYCSREIN